MSYPVPQVLATLLQDFQVEVVIHWRPYHERLLSVLFEDRKDWPKMFNASVLEAWEALDQQRNACEPRTLGYLRDEHELGEPAHLGTL